MSLMVIPTLGWTSSDIEAFTADVEALANHFEKNVTVTVGADYCIEIGGDIDNSFSYLVMKVTPDELQ